MIDLDLLKYKSDIRRKKNNKGQDLLFDPVRKSWIVANSEEFVRQLLIQYLFQEKGISFALMSVEKGIIVNSLQKRFDLLIYNQQGEPKMLVECKSPNIPLNQEVFDQISMYNVQLQVPFLMICNGRFTIISQLNLDSKDFIFIDDIPDSDMINSI